MLLTAAVLAMTLLVYFTNQRRQPNFEAVSFERKQLQSLMFEDASDSAEYVRQCGRDWTGLFTEWEEVQRRAIDKPVDAKAVVWKCDGALCGGLGDRQRGILTSFMLALVTGRAFFIKDDSAAPLQHYFHVGNPSLHWRFEESHLEGRTVLHESFLDGIPPIGDYADSNLAYYDSYDYVFQANNFWQPFHILHNPNITGWAKNLRFDDHVLAGCLLNYLLVPARDVQATLQQVRRSVTAQRHRLLAVQIRTGDSQDKNTTVLTDLVQQFQTCVKNLSNVSPAAFDIFLTTDSNEALVAFRAAYPSLLTFAGDIYHIDGKFGAPVNADAAFRKTVLDHLMISQADDLLISRSGFAEYAAVRGFKPYYTPTNCNPGRPIPHYVMPTSSPIPIDT